MKYANLKWIAATIVAVVVVGGAFVAAAGVRDAGSKIRGDFNSFHRSASRGMRNSRAVTQDFRAHAQEARRNNQRVTPAVARSHAEELGQSIKLTQKYLAEERKLAEGDKEILASLDVIDKSIQEESAQQAAMLDMCKGEEVDAQGTSKCCEDAEKAIDKANAEHEKLMQKLGANK